MVRRRKLASRLLMPAPQNREKVWKKGSLYPEKLQVPACRRRYELEITIQVVSHPSAGGVDDYQQSEPEANGAGCKHQSDLDWILFGIARSFAGAGHRANQRRGSVLRPDQRRRRNCGPET